MKFPELYRTGTQRLFTEQFIGLDRRPRTIDGACGYMENMSGDPSPLLSSRKKRGLVETLSTPRGLIAAGKLGWIDGGTLYYDGTATPVNDLSQDAGMLPKKLVSMGAYIVIFPDGAYYNTSNPAEYGRIDRLYQSPESGNVTYHLCAMDGTLYDDEKITVSDSAPENPADGDYWMDTSEETHYLKQWRDSYGMWMGVGTVYIKISCTGIGIGIKAGDGVELSGITYNGTGGEAVKKQYEALNTTMIVQACGDDYLVVIGIIDQSYTQATGTVRADRKAPRMDYVVECNNRLWGCRSGIEEGKALNEIYACALGDFKNWRKYAGNSQDSYAVSVGTDGPFTGAITHRGQPYFFKENCVHKIYGEKPSNYQMQTTLCDGVRKGCDGTLQAVNGTLYYLGLNGVCYFETLPMDASDALGEERFDEATAGEYDGKYYISMRGAGGKWSLYCLNTLKGTWHREDESHAISFARLGDEIYMLLSDGRLYAINGTDGEKEKEIFWRADSAVMGYEYPDHKYLSRFNLRMKLGSFADCRLYIEYDSSGIWEEKGHMTGSGEVKTYTLPVVPRRCDHLRLSIRGRGEIQLYSVARILGVGSDG